MEQRIFLSAVNKLFVFGLTTVIGFDPAVGNDHSTTTTFENVEGGARLLDETNHICIVEPGEHYGEWITCTTIDEFIQERDALTAAGIDFVVNPNW